MGERIQRILRTHAGMGALKEILQMVAWVRPMWEDPGWNEEPEGEEQAGESMYSLREEVQEEGGMALVLVLDGMELELRHVLHMIHQQYNQHSDQLYI